jgi:quinol monooxygenase YgiN
MVLYVLKWDILPDSRDAYHAWLEPAIQRTLAVPGVVEFRAYETVAGPHRKVATYEFADLAAWQTWFNHREVQQVLSEMDTLTTSRTRDLWGPTGVAIRPGQQAREERAS